MLDDNLVTSSKVLGSGIKKENSNPDYPIIGNDSES